MLAQCIANRFTMPGKQRPNSEKTKEAKRRNVEKARRELSKIVKRGKEIVSDSEESDWTKVRLCTFGRNFPNSHPLL